MNKFICKTAAGFDFSLPTAVFCQVAAKLGIVVLVLLQTSFLTPPLAHAVLYAMGVAPPEVTTGDAYRGVVPFILIQLFVVMICVFFPVVTTFLPDLIIRGW